MGESVDPPSMPRGNPILCSCGRRIGVETADGGVWRAEYHHTSMGAAEVLFYIALEDAELLAGMEKRGELWEDSRDIAETLLSFFRLVDPDKSGDLSALAAVLPRLVVPPHLYKRSALDLDTGTVRMHNPVAAAMPTGCKKCRLIYDLREVVGSGVRNKRGALLVGGCRPASIEDYGYQAPASGVRSRVFLYRRLNAVLSSKHSASLVGEASPVK